MGKKKAPAPGPSDVAYLARLRNRKCLRCDAPRRPDQEMHCASCVAEGARVFELAARRRVVLWTDPRYLWPAREHFVSWLDELAE